MKTPTLAALVTALAKAQATAFLDTFENHLAALPFDHYGDAYRSNPEAACRAALRATRTIHRPSRRLRAVDRLLGMHGIESVSYRNGSHAFSYCNAGDTYDCTVVLFPSGRFRVTSWGDIVERASHRYL